MAMSSSYKPSPLGYGTPRNSPFRRPESPSSPLSLRQTTPSASPHKATPSGSGTAFSSPTKVAASPSSITTTNNWTTRLKKTPQSPADTIETDLGGRNGIMPSGLSHQQQTVSAPIQVTALTQLQPTQVRALREGFQVLDRDGDGTVGREDVADMLNQLGLPSSPSDVSQFFPPSTSQTISMGTFLNTLATALAALSPSTELLSALSAFDEDDTGEVDLMELRDALLHTAPEPGSRPLTEAEINSVMTGFTGRRAFTNKSRHGAGFSKRGEVFRYQDFVQAISCSNLAATPEAESV